MRVGQQQVNFDPSKFFSRSIVRIRQNRRSEVLEANFNPSSFSFARDCVPELNHVKLNRYAVEIKKMICVV